jgi:aryl-alcohol dehydrogenase-like predicted oxidoreductase
LFLRVNIVRLSPDAQLILILVNSVEASLKRLNTDYIDVLWLHIWDFMTPVEEVMRAFDDLVRAGKVLYIGISDAPAWQENIPKITAIKPIG